MIENILKGYTPRPPIIMVYGPEGVGKSTFAASAPNPVFVQTEDGLGEIDCAKFPLASTTKEIFAELDAVLTEAHDYRTLVIDSADWTERVIWREICEQYRVKSIGAAAGGYGKGYEIASSVWGDILAKVDRIRKERKMCVIFTAHETIEHVDDPDVASYDRRAPKLHRTSCAMLKEACDYILYAGRKIAVRSEDGKGKAIAVGGSGGERYLRTIGTPSCVAKQRHRTGIPEELPLKWDAFFGAVYSTNDNNQK